MRVDGSGNVGIGTTSPGNMGFRTNLDIAGGFYGGALTIYGDDTSTKLVGWFDSGATQTAKIGTQSSNQLDIMVDNAERLSITTAGNVGIGSTAPQTTLHLSTTASSTLTIQNTTNSGNATLNFRDEGGTDQYSIYYALGANRAYNLVNGNGLTIYSSQASGEIARFGTATGYTDSYFTGNVGIGTTAPSTKLQISGGNSSTPATALFSIQKNEEGYGLFSGVLGSGVSWMQSATKTQSAYYGLSLQPNGGNVGIGTTTPSQKLHVEGNATVTGVIYTNIVQTLSGTSIDFRHQDASTIMRVDTANARVGIGTTAPLYKLVVAGSIHAGGKLTYEKSAGSLDTTGYAVAGLLAASNGSSCMFTFTAIGNTGHYQKVVYSCWNAAGTWNTSKVIDEGTNGLDIEASTNAATITFTFKSRSGSLNYTPRVTVEASGSAINNTYA